MNPPYSHRQGDDSAYEQATLNPRYPWCACLRQRLTLHFYSMGFIISITGTMAIVLPHGVLFRGGDEAMIRQNL